MKITELKQLREDVKNFEIDDFDLNFKLFQFLINADTALGAYDMLIQKAKDKQAEFQEKVIALNEKYCVRKNGNPIIKNNQYSFSDAKVPIRQASYDSLVSTYGKWTNATNESDPALKTILESDVEIELPVLNTDTSLWKTDAVVNLSVFLPDTVSSDKLPKNMTAKDMYLLSKRGKNIVKKSNDKGPKK